MSDDRKAAEVRLLTDIGIEYETACDVLTKIAALSQPADAGLVELVQEAADQFRFYEGQHRAKGTHEAAGKAEVNRRLAEKMEAGIAAHRARTSRGQDQAQGGGA